jgi:hypothetical protein
MASEDGGAVALRYQCVRISNLPTLDAQAGLLGHRTCDRLRCVEAENLPFRRCELFIG